MPPHSNDDDDDLPLPRHTVATNLPPPQTQPLKRRQSRFLRRPRKRQRAQPSNEEEALFEAAASLSDIAVAVQTLHGAWPQEARNRLTHTPPVILVKQIYALVSDCTTIDFEVEKLARGEWRKVILPGEEQALVKMVDFSIVSSSEVGQRFVRDVLPRVKVPVVMHKELEETFGEDVAGVLIREGFLTMRDEESYWLAVPGMGEFLRNRATGNKELLAILKRAPYQEMLISNLEMRTLKKSMFTAQWHVRDIVGGGVAETVGTTLGTLVRLRETR